MSSGQLGVKRSICDKNVNSKRCKYSKSSHFIGPIPRYGSYLHAIWRVTEQLPAMRDKYSEIEKDPDYIRRYLDAWNKIYERTPKKVSLPVYNGEQYGLFSDMKAHCESAQSETNARQLRHKLELAWQNYIWLKEKQREQNGGAHPTLRPPTLNSGSKIDIMVNLGTVKTGSVDFVPENDLAVTRETETALSYSCSSVQWTKPNIEVPETSLADPLEEPFQQYRPEEYLAKHLSEKGGLLDYCSELEEKMGSKCGIWKRVRMQERAGAVWQKTINHVATAHNKDYSLAVATSNLAAGKELLRELHRRLCRKMTLLKSFKRVQKNGLTDEGSTESSQYITGEISEEQLAQITDSVEQERGVEGVVKATVDMTRFTFTQLEKVLMSNKSESDIVRKPKCNSKRHQKSTKVQYEIKNEGVAHDFFRQAIDGPLLTASKHGKNYKAEISPQHPMKIGHRGTEACSPVKVWVEVFYRTE